MNESAAADFHLCKLEAIRIGDSLPAPLLTQIAGPSEEARDLGRRKKEWTERERLRYRFFQGLLEHAKPVTPLHANISPSKGTWLSAGSGIAGVSFTYRVRQTDALVELYIDTADGDWNRRAFETIREDREKIETKFGSRLEWDRKEERRACKIQKSYTTGGYRDEDKWETVYEELATAMKKLHKALDPHLKKLKKAPPA